MFYVINISIMSKSFYLSSVTFFVCVTTLPTSFFANFQVWVYTNNTKILFSKGTAIYSQSLILTHFV